MHSDKIDYINEIYRPLLNLRLMKNYYLILPLPDKYKSSYIKELYKDSDIVICDLTKSNMFLNIEIKTGDRVSIIGENGCGKTTVLNIINSIESINSGTIAIRRGAKIGYLNQQPENVYNNKINAER